MTEQKQCRTCRRWKPRDRDHFKRAAGAMRGWRPDCLECRALFKREVESA